MAITIPGGGGSVLVFTVEGSAATNYATDFANAVVGLTPTNLGTSTVTSAFNIFLGGVGAPSSFTLGTSSEISLFASGQPDTISLSGSSETIVSGFLSTVNETGASGDNRIIFEGGTNVFNGSSVGGAGDTIVGSIGSDTINTGTGNATVFTGNASVTLNDTKGGAGGDVAVVTGNATVNASGVSDTVYAYGGGSIVGGVGALTYVAIDSPDGSAPLPSTIVGGSGSTAVFLTSFSDVTYKSTSTSNLATVVAGAGNETLNAATDVKGLYFFGDTTASATSPENYHITGGSGANFFATGTGDETFNIGAGSTDFVGISGATGATITLSDLAAASSYSINIAGLTVSEETALVNSGTETGGNLTVSLPNGSTIEFISLTASQVDSHLV